MAVEQVKLWNKERDGAEIRVQYEPTEFEKKQLEMVYTRKQAMEDSKFRKDAEKQWAKGWIQWEAMREERADDDWQSNHYVPMTTSIVETELSEVIDQSPQPLILPRGSEDIPRAMVMKNIFEYTWEIADGDLELYNVLKDAFICGTSIAQEYYWRDVRKIKTSKKKGSEEYETDDVTDYDDCYMECVRLEDYFVDEKARGFTGPYGARDCIRRYIMDIDDVRLFFSGEKWNPLDNVKYVKPGGDVNYYEWYSPPEGIDKERDVEVLWYWSKKPEDWLIIVANDVMIYMGPNPYKHKQLPFARAVDTKRTHRFYGKGQAEMLESIQDETNLLRRMVIDRNHLDIDKMFLVSSRLNLADEDLIARPHGLIPTDDTNATRAVEYGDVPRSVEMSLKHLEDDATIVTGVNPRAQALPTTGTATEAAILKESTLKRIRLKMRLFEREFLTQIARLRVSNILQYYAQPKLEKILGESGTEAYKKQITELQSKGLYVKEEGGDYKKTFRQIRLKDKQIQFDPSGTPQEVKAKGYTFFEADPKYFTPTAQGGFNIKILAGSTLPISKPLMQTKASEMYDRLIQNKAFDPEKLGDMLMEVNDFNPEDYKVVTEQQSESEARLAMLVDLANTENQLMMQGKPVPPTPFSSPVHTRIHVSFTSSPPFQEMNKSDPRIKIFMDHVSGEIAAQQQRQMGQMAGADPNAPQDPGAAAGALGAPQPQTPAGPQQTSSQVVPALIQGGGQVPAGI